MGKKKNSRPRVQESDNAIPPDATEIVSVSGSTGINPLETDDIDVVSTKKNKILHPSLALVAPDTTPDWDVPLLPTQVPEPTSTIPTPQKAADMSASQLMSLSRKSKAANSADQTAQAEALAQSIVAPVSALNEGSALDGKALLAEGVPMPEPVKSNSANNLLTAFKFV